MSATQIVSNTVIAFGAESDGHLADFRFNRPVINLGFSGTGKESEMADLLAELDPAALCVAFERLTKAGVDKLHYIPGETLPGADGEGLTDGLPPNDLRFMRQAEVFSKTLASWLTSPR